MRIRPCRALLLLLLAPVTAWANFIEVPTTSAFAKRSAASSFTADRLTSDSLGSGSSCALSTVNTCPRVVSLQALELTLGDHLSAPSNQPSGPDRLGYPAVSTGLSDTLVGGNPPVPESPSYSIPEPGSLIIGLGAIAGFALRLRTNSRRATA